MQKIDLHLHLRLAPAPDAGGQAVSTYLEMLPHLDALGIEKGVLMSCGEHPTLPFGTVGSNEENRAIAAARPDRYAWACNLDCRDPGTVYDRLARYKAEGAVGVGELMINRPFDDPFLQEIFAAAGALDLPVTFHMSPAVGYKYGVVDDPGLPRLEAMLRKYPRTRFLGHSQTFWIEISGDAPADLAGRDSWGSGPVAPGGRVPALFAQYPNLYGDLSANSAGCALMRDPDFGLRFLETYADRLFFATDMVNTGMTFPLGGWLDEQAAAGRLSRDAYRAICRGNAQRVFGL